jgi:hypothetical protein
MTVYQRAPRLARSTRETQVGSMPEAAGQFLLGDGGAVAQLLERPAENVQLRRMRDSLAGSPV